MKLIVNKVSQGRNYALGGKKGVAQMTEARHFREKRMSWVQKRAELGQRTRASSYREKTY